MLRRKLARLLRMPEFWLVTLVGNALTAAGAWGFYLAETGLNASLRSRFDAFWWSVQTVTSVGYGDIVAVTSTGKVVGIVMMILGTALFASYTALFAGVLLAPDIAAEVERELDGEQRALHDQLHAIERQLFLLRESLRKRTKGSGNR